MIVVNSGQSAYITSLGLATPPFRVEQRISGKILADRTAHMLSERSISVMRKLFAHPSISSRCFAVDDSETIFNEDPDSRIARFTRWSIDLASEAMIKALDGACVDIDAVTGLIVNTCTGYICPGISTYLIEKLGLPRNVRVYDLLGSGCGGAIPNIQLAEAFVRQADAGAVVSVSVEICSATFQMADDLSLIVSNTIFGDGAAAAVIQRKKIGLEIVDTASYFVPEDREHIRYIHKSGQLHNQLSVGLHKHVRKAAAQVVNSLLSRRSLKMADISHWALHTGGEKIINSIRDEIGLSEDQVAAARSILSDYGNMSSPTVYFVLNKLVETGMNKGDLCMMVAFGAGLSAHACLLKKV
ncbi:MAG TPA: type III polyketide synthase [Dissulfurispiraceae bacterium]|nr:type III polyketide synthase [Dissulfurispiraceae bacterium]